MTMPMGRALVAFACLLTMLSAVAQVNAAAPKIEIGTTGATTNFPAGITFEVKATAARPIVKAELLYTKAEVETLNLVTADVTTGTTIDVALPVDFRGN
jgi:hypothetical protein